MAKRTRHGRFTPWVLAAGLATTVAPTYAATPQAAAAAPPQVLVYVVPEWQLENVYSPPETAVRSEPQPQPALANEAQVRAAAHQAAVRAATQYRAADGTPRYAWSQATDSAAPSARRDASAAEYQPPTAYAVEPTTSSPVRQTALAEEGAPAVAAPYDVPVNGVGPCCEVYPRWVTGMELVFVKPEIDDGLLEAELEDTAGVGREETLSLDDFDTENPAVAPRFWLGIQGACWGVVTRVWWLDQCENDHSIFRDGDDLGHDFASELDMYTVDLEVTRRLCLSEGRALATFGVRHASAERNGSLDMYGETPDGIFASFARFGQEADGTGLTGSLSMARPVWCGSCLHWYGSIRGSILWGDTALYSDTAALTDAGASASNTAVVWTEDEMLIGEAHLGLQWDRCLQCVPATVFVRTAFEYQHWSANGGSTIAESFAGFGTSLITTTAATDGIDVNLFGLSIATGLNW